MTHLIYKGLVTVAVMLYLTGLCYGAIKGVEPGSFREISLSSDPNMIVSSNAKPVFMFGAGFSPDMALAYFLEFSKNFDTHSRGRLFYQGVIDGDIKDIYGLSYASRLYWNDEKRVGMKGRFMLEHYNFVSGLSVQTLRANMLFGKRIGKGILFAGYKGRLFLHKSSNNYKTLGEALTSRMYVGAEYPVLKWLSLYTDYIGDNLSVGVQLKYPAPELPIKYQMSDSRLVVGHPYHGY